MPYLDETEDNFYPQNHNYSDSCGKCEHLDDNEYNSHCIQQGQMIEFVQCCTPSFK